MAKKSLKTRANVHGKRGELPQQQPKIVNDKPLDRLLGKAEKVGLILHGSHKREKK